MSWCLFLLQKKPEDNPIRSHISFFLFFFFSFLFFFFPGGRAAAAAAAAAVATPGRGTVPGADTIPVAVTDTDAGAHPGRPAGLGFPLPYVLPCPRPTGRGAKERLGCTRDLRVGRWRTRSQGWRGEGAEGGGVLILQPAWHLRSVLPVLQGGTPQLILHCLVHGSVVTVA